METPNGSGLGVYFELTFISRMLSAHFCDEDCIVSHRIISQVSYPTSHFQCQGKYIVRFTRGVEAQLQSR